MANKGGNKVKRKRGKKFRYYADGKKTNEV
jgi:hypothetical protein